MKKRGYLQVSFGWMFAILVGAFILFLAIYASGKFIDIGSDTKAVQTGKEIGVLLNPLETGFESGKTNSMTMPVETRIHNLCDSRSGNFGVQGIRVSQKSFDEWSETNMQTNFPNKYLFSNSTIQGEKFYLFSKPFSFPYKIADLIYITSSEKLYCFIDTPENIKRELELLEQENIKVNCSESETENSIKVCFGEGNCDVEVDYDGEKVNKKGEILDFKGDALMYAAVFSDPEVYECQLKRLVKRIKNLALLYQEKTSVTSSEGCSYRINLGGLINKANSYEDSTDLHYLYQVAEEVNGQNRISECRLW